MTIRFIPDEIERLSISSLKPYSRNPRTHSDDQIAKIAASLVEYGWTAPVMVADGGEIVAGHGRLLAAKHLGLEDVPIIRLSHLTPEQVRAYRIADNRLSELAGWNDELLTTELHALNAAGFDMDLTGFDGVDLDRLLAPLDDVDGLAGEDDIPEPPLNPVSRLGDLWMLGNHRLLCGDATNAEDVVRLMAGVQAQMVFTDPPYGVEYTGGMKKRERLSGDHIGTDIYGASLRHLVIAADDRASLYLWYADANAAAAAAAAAAAGYQIVAQIIWAKNHAQFVTSAHYKGKHEPCFYAHRRGKSARWHGPNNEVTLWEHDRAPRNDFHPTQKPVALAQRAIANSSQRGDAVLDMFLGGGSTLIAAENTGRTCYALEIEPAYIDVAVTRWQTATGKQATLDGDGRTFDDIASERLPRAA